MEYLNSQTGDGALQRELARDPGAAEEEDDEEEEEEDEEDEEEEDQEEDEGFSEELPGIHAILQDRPDRPAVAEEEVCLVESAEGGREG